MADFNSKYSGEQVEELLDRIANGGEVPEGGVVGSDVYVTDITMEMLEDALYTGSQYQCDTQSLANAIRAGKRVFIKTSSDNSIYGLLPLNGEVNGDYITFSVMSQNAEIYLCWINENSMSIDSTNIQLIRETYSAPFSWQNIEYLVEHADGYYDIGRVFLDAISNDCIIRIGDDEGGFIVASQCSGYRDGLEAGFSMRFTAPDNKVYNIFVNGSLDEQDSLRLTHEHITVETMATVDTVNQAIADAITTTLNTPV